MRPTRLGVTPYRLAGRSLRGARRLGAAPYRLAGRSLRPSWAPLTRMCLRCAIHGFAGHIRRLNGRGSPSPPQLVVAMQFRRSRSVGTRRRRESLRTLSRQGRRPGSAPADGGRPRNGRQDAVPFREASLEHASLGSECGSLLATLQVSDACSGITARSSVSRPRRRRGSARRVWRRRRRGAGCGPGGRPATLRSPPPRHGDGGRLPGGDDHSTPP
jgi:hypothetical protein